MFDKAKPPSRLDLAAIETSLCSMLTAVDDTLQDLDAERGEFNVEVCRNMLEGYARVDYLLAEGVDLFERGNSPQLLELNNIVLYGSDPERRERYASSIAANEERFYGAEEGGVSELVEQYQMHAHESAWSRAALVHIHVLSQPQLFIEGNNRTGALFMSYLLARDGHPPFVLTPENARGFFAKSRAIGSSKRRSVVMTLLRFGLKRYFAKLLQRNAEPKYLLDPKEARECADDRKNPNRAPCSG